MSIASPGRFSFSVVKAWLMPPTPTVRVARVRFPVRSSTCAAVHQGRKPGYASMSSTSAYISAAECSTIADRAMFFI
jgi:hypothetical protein